MAYMQFLVALLFVQLGSDWLRQWDLDDKLFKLRHASTSVMLSHNHYL